ncbi:hypothetical protein BDZ88DRAFT_171004 [Geranomyces variabilis]|nr:hypothetical protein BDZ88DRAFT_171004 [Geranomyces variabilis]
MERLDVYMTIGMVHALADSGDKTKGNGTTNKQVRLFGTQVSINKEMLMKILDNDVARYNALKKGLVRIAVAEPGETHVSAYINGENLDGIPDIIWQEAERIAIVISPDPADNTRDRENWELYNRIKPRRNGQKKLVAFCALVAALSDGKVPRLDDDDDLNERATITAERRISGAKKRQAEADAAAREAKRK